MKLEELKKTLFLLEHGYFDDKVVAMANKNKAKNIDMYVLRGDEIVVHHDGGICGFYGQAPDFGRELLKSYRRDWIKLKYPEIKKLIEGG